MFLQSGCIQSHGAHSLLCCALKLTAPQGEGLFLYFAAFGDSITVNIMWELREGIVGRQRRSSYSGLVHVSECVCACVCLAQVLSIVHAY